MATRPVAYCISCDEKTEYIVKACKRDIIVKGNAAMNSLFPRLMTRMFSRGKTHIAKPQV